MQVSDLLNALSSSNRERERLAKELDSLQRTFQACGLWHFASHFAMVGMKLHAMRLLLLLYRGSVHDSPRPTRSCGIAMAKSCS